MSKKKLEQKHTRAKTHKSKNTQGQSARANAHRSKKSTRAKKHSLFLLPFSPSPPGFPPPPLPPSPPLLARTCARAPAMPRACAARRAANRLAFALPRPPSLPQRTGLRLVGWGFRGLRARDGMWRTKTGASAKTVPSAPPHSTQQSVRYSCAYQTRFADASRRV